MPRSIQEIYKDVEWMTVQREFLYNIRLLMEDEFPWLETLYDDPCHCGSIWCRVHVFEDPDTLSLIKIYNHIRDDLKEYEDEVVSKD